MKIVITEFMDAPAVTRLKTRFEVVHDPTLVDRPDDLSRQLGDADALIVRNRTRVERALIDSAPRLKVVGRLGVGLDNIDLAACAARGIEIIPATGANARAVAEYVIATAMLLIRRAYLASVEVADGEWPRQRLSEGGELAGKTLGLVGLGNIGKLTARLANALDLNVIGFDLNVPHSAWNESAVGRRSFDALLGEADIVSLHVPLEPATRHLFGRAALARMKPGAILINAARGGIVDEAALADALANGHLSGAALDVYEHEPLPAGSPLAAAPNLILTPHIAGVTRESNRRVSDLIAERVGEFLDSPRFQPEAADPAGERRP